MLRAISTFLNGMRARQAQAADRIACFHCGDSVKRSKAVAVAFDGEQRQVCCHGCAAVLNTVEQMGMTAQYLEQKRQSAAGNE
jgi:hypothetical protein